MWLSCAGLLQQLTGAVEDRFGRRRRRRVAHECFKVRAQAGRSSEQSSVKSVKSVETGQVGISIVGGQSAGWKKPLNRVVTVHRSMLHWACHVVGGDHRGVIATISQQVSEILLSCGASQKSAQVKHTM